MWMLCCSQVCFAQWSENELKPYLQKVDKHIKDFTDHKIQSGEWNRENDALEIAFTADTMRIERTASLLNNEHYSTLDMHNTLSFCMMEYDKLLNKYYRLIMDKLTDADKVKFRDAQRLWLQYRDSEAKINSDIIASGKYTGGGTMWGLFAVARNLGIIKERVIGFYGFLECI
jgi:uncharacterized protein YecT (DUF1311 family)